MLILLVCCSIVWFLCFQRMRESQRGATCYISCPGFIAPKHSVRISFGQAVCATALTFEGLQVICTFLQLSPQEGKVAKTPFELPLLKFLCVFLRSHSCSLPPQIPAIWHVWPSTWLLQSAFHRHVIAKRVTAKSSTCLQKNKRQWMARRR